MTIGYDSAWNEIHVKLVVAKQLIIALMVCLIATEPYRPRLSAVAFTAAAIV
jgi:hypothetical protein